MESVTFSDIAMLYGQLGTYILYLNTLRSHITTHKCRKRKINSHIKASQNHITSPETRNWRCVDKPTMNFIVLQSIVFLLKLLNSFFPGSSVVLPNFWQFVWMKALLSCYWGNCTLHYYIITSLKLHLMLFHRSYSCNVHNISRTTVYHNVRSMQYVCRHTHCILQSTHMSCISCLASHIHTSIRSIP